MVGVGRENRLQEYRSMKLSFWRWIFKKGKIALSYPAYRKS